MRKTRLREENGQITVLLTLFLSVLFFFFLVTLEIIRYEQAKGRVEQASVGVVENVMADFQIEMANWYHIYTVDENYLGRGKEVLNNRAWNYLEQNLSGVSTQWGVKNLYSFSVENAEVETVDYLTDNGCHRLKQQIHSWNSNPLSLVPKRQKREKEVVQAREREETTYSSQNGDYLEQIDPRYCIDRIKRIGILTVASNKQLPLSKKKYDRSDLPSSSVQWTEETETSLPKAMQRLELENYIFHHFHSALTIALERETALENEIEYCITGKASDYDALEAVAKKIVALRLPINRAYLAKDGKKQKEAWVLAGAIAALIKQPEATEKIQKGILASWAYGESVMDVKCLLAGKKVPEVKTKKTWKLTLSQLFHLKSASVSDEKKGLDYEQYLKLLFVAVPEKKVYLRMADLMQLSIDEKYPSFQIQNCMGSYRVLGNVQMRIQFFALPVKKGDHYGFVVDKSGSFHT